MSAPTLHIFFSSSAAGTYRQLLMQEGSGDQVIDLFDPLSIGPIDSVDSEDRLEALIRLGVLDRETWEAEPDFSRSFWQSCAESQAPRTLWVSRRSSDELAGFHAYLHRFGDVPCRIVDLAEGEERLRDVTRRRDATYFSLGELPHHPLGALKDIARPLAGEEVDGIRRRWESLVKENAPLRIADRSGLRSAPETLLDEDLLARCSSAWRRTARVIAELIIAVPETRGFALSDFFFEWRIDRLLAQGALESREDPNAGHFRRKAWVRIPAA